MPPEGRGGGRPRGCRPSAGSAGVSTRLIDLLAQCGIDADAPVRPGAHDAGVSWRSTRAAGHLATEPRQVAVIDLGSNSWRLVVFSYAPGGWWKRTDELYETVRIGAGMERSGRLSDEAIDRGMETLSVFARFCRANRLSGDQSTRSPRARFATRPTRRISSPGRSARPGSRSRCSPLATRPTTATSRRSTRRP